jgi:hypothetical protein
MNYLHYDFQAGPNDVIEVTLDKAANVLLMNPSNYTAYRAGRNYRYYGGHSTQSPVRVSPPHHTAPLKSNDICPRNIRHQIIIR